MPDYFISNEKAENDLLACAAFVAERIKSSDGHAEAMNSIIPRYLASGNVDLAAELSNAINDPYSRDKLLIIVAEKCAELDDEEYGLQLAEAIDDDGVRAQALERIALVAAGKGQIERAAAIAEAIPHPDFVDAGIAVYQAKNGDSVGADATIAKIEFPTASISAYQQIASEFIEQNKYDEASAILDRAAAAAEEIEHDEERIRTLCEVGNAFIEAKSDDRAIAAFDSARGYAEVLDNTHRDFLLVNCALGYLQAGSGETADRTLDLVMDKTQMASALLGFARNSWLKDEKDDAIETLEEAYAIINSQRENETRDSRTRNAVITRIAVQFAGFGKSDRSAEIALNHADPIEQMETLSQIAQVQTAQREDDLARQTFILIRDDATRVLALVAMSDAKNKLGETVDAVALLDEAAILSETVEQLGPRCNILNEIAARYVDAGEIEKARSRSLENLGLLIQIRDESTKAAALAGLSEIYNGVNLSIGESEKELMRQTVIKSDF